MAFGFLGIAIFGVIFAVTLARYCCSPHDDTLIDRQHPELHWSERLAIKHLLNRVHGELYRGPRIVSFVVLVLSGLQLGVTLILILLALR